jgi:ABC-type sulfate/molybdate transport systems ATPase subunit
LLLDEPLAALDVSVRRDTRQFLAYRLRAVAILHMLVTHDLADAEALASDVVVIVAGRALWPARSRPAQGRA